MNVGYYYANNSGYGINAWREVKGYTNVYMDYEPGYPLPGLLGKRLWVTLGMLPKPSLADTPEGVRELLRPLVPYWGKVIALELGDELGWPASKLAAKAQMVRAVVAGLKLTPKLIGVTLSESLLFMSDAWRTRALDWVGLEAYLTERAGETQARAAARMSDYIGSMVHRVDQLAPTKKLILVGQGYNRNGAWKDMATLVAIQRPTFEAAKQLGDRLLMLALFAYVRGSREEPVGTRYLPELKAEHERLRRLYP